MPDRQPAGEIGYLPQDPSEGDLDVSARDRVLSARGLDVLVADLEKAQTRWPRSPTRPRRSRATARYGQIEERFVALGGYGAGSEAAPDLLEPGPARPGADAADAHAVRGAAPTGRAGAGSCSPPPGGDGVRRRPATTLLLDEPTNHLDADSSAGCGISCGHSPAGGVICHDVELIAAVVNRVWFLDAVRGELDVYNMGWQRTSTPGPPMSSVGAASVPTPNEGRRVAGPGRQAGRQGHQGRCGPTDVASRRPDDRPRLDEVRVPDRVARIRFPRRRRAGARRSPRPRG